MMKLVTYITLASFFLSSCSLITPKPRPVEIKTVAVKRAPLNLKTDYPMELEDLDWVIVTRDNQEEVFKELESKNTTPVIIGLTDKGYENLSVNNAKILSLIQIYKKLIESYKKYYESPDKEDPPQANSQEEK